MVSRPCLNKTSCRTCKTRRSFPSSLTLATKDKAVLKLMADRGLAGAELVVFGDAANDFGMFCAADRAIAVANAIPSILERATEVIGPNTDDSVMRFIRDDWRRLTASPA